MDDFYTLLSYSRRSAVFAMRDGSQEHIRDGLMAISMIDLGRIDYRDALVALGLLYHAAFRIGVPTHELFQRAALLSEPSMSELILEFIRRNQHRHDVRDWGYAVVDTATGPGFVQWDCESYEPKYPLEQIGLALARLARQDMYGDAHVTLASDLPAIWLSSVDDNALKRARKAIRGAVSISAMLRPQESPASVWQSLMMFLVELDDDAAAETLLRLSREKQMQANGGATIDVKEGRLFCLAVARSFQEGTKSFETQVSLERFSSGIAAALRNHL